MSEIDIGTRERPIIMSGPMVRAILEGRKTVTRRVVKPQPACGCRYEINGAESGALQMVGTRSDPIVFVPPTPTSKDYVLRCPYGRPGDRLWVRETFAPRLDVDPATEPQKARHYALYRANGTGLDEPHWHAYPDRWTPAIHMPRWASRLTLRVEAVKVERVQEISEEDARAEGRSLDPNDPAGYFPATWDAINKARGFGWESNPYVWCVTFSRIADAPESP
jgi:hypothetical protein